MGFETTSGAMALVVVEDLDEVTMEIQNSLEEDEEALAIVARVIIKGEEGEAADQVDKGIILLLPESKMKNSQGCIVAHCLVSC